MRVMSLRGAPHLHRRGDLDVLRDALATADADDLEGTAGPLGPKVAALDDPVGALAEAMVDWLDAGDRTEPVSKADLSAAITSSIDPAFIGYCERCDVDHSPDGLFRLATLRAGLELDPSATRQSFLRADRPDPSMPSESRRRDARRQVVATAASLAVDGKADQLGTWLGLSLASVRPALDAPVAGPARSRRTRSARLLPARDPWLSGSDRAWMLGDDVDRRSQVFRAIGAPGVVLVDGEIVGTWKQRKERNRLSIEIDRWHPGREDEAEQLAGDAKTIAATRDLEPEVAGLR